MVKGRKVVLTDDQRVALNAAILRSTAKKLARQWDLSDNVLLRAANGYQITRGTRALILIGLGLQQEEN